MQTGLEKKNWKSGYNRKDCEMPEQFTEPIIIDKPFDLELLANKIADTLDDEFHIYDTEPHVPDGANEVLLDHSMGTHVSRVIQRAILMHIKD